MKQLPFHILASLLAPSVRVHMMGDDGKKKKKTTTETAAGVREVVREFLQERGGATDEKTTEVVSKMYDKLAAMEAERDEAIEARDEAVGKAPKEGERVLSKEQAEAFAKVEAAFGEHKAAFGVDGDFKLDAIAKMIEEGAGAKVAKAADSQKADRKRAADIAGVTNLPLLNSLTGVSDIPLKFVGEGDKATALAVVTDASGVTKEVPYKDHLEAAFPDVAPLLFNSAPAGASGGGAAGGSAPVQSPAGGNGGSAPADVTQKVIARTRGTF